MANCTSTVYTSPARTASVEFRSYYGGGSALLVWSDGVRGAVMGPSKVRRQREILNRLVSQNGWTKTKPVRKDA